MQKRYKKVGLALSGGAVLGIAHLGVISVLEENKIPIDIVAGTSAGSMVGAFLAAGFSTAQMLKMVKSLSWGKISKITIPKMGLLNSKLMERFIDSIIGRIDISELKKPYAAVAVDLSSGRQVIFQKGLVAEAVRASCAIPGIFTPPVRGNQVLVDGGVLNFLPTDVVKQMGADYIISVKLIPAINHKPPENIIQVLLNSFLLALTQIAEHAPEGNITITPDLSHLNPYDFDQVDNLYQRGRDAALKVIDQIKDDLRSRARFTEILKTVKKKIIPVE